MKRIIQFVALILISCIVAGCGEKSQEDVFKKLDKTIGNSNYDVTATMEINDQDKKRVYDIVVWHTKPSFYRVQINEKDSGESQVIVKNEEGVFLQSPSSNKTYRFQTEWPEKNSQSYLIGTLIEDIRLDKEATMKATDSHYVFEAATRNSSRTGLNTQQITFDKKTYLPTKVTLLDDSLNEKISISFSNINLKANHKPDEYKLSEASSEQTFNTEPFKVRYPTATENSELIDEVVIAEKGKERAILSYKGDKSFTIIQYPIQQADKLVTVSVKGDPEWIGNTYAAIDDNTLSWDEDGISYLITSDQLNTIEMVKIAASLSSENRK